MKATLAIQVLPQTSSDQETCRIVDEVIATIAASGLRYEVGPLETTIEGDDYEQLMGLATDCLRTALCAGCDKTSAYIKVIASSERPILSIEEKVGKYRGRKADAEKNPNEKPPCAGKAGV